MKISRTRIFRILVRIFNKLFPILLSKLRYRKTFGKKLNLTIPQNLNEKILWLSFYSDTSKWAELSDKYAVRDYVKNRGLDDILVKLYGKWDCVEDIVWDDLPNSFVMKTNNGCDTVLIVKDKSKLDLDKIKHDLRIWLKKDISAETAEFHYRQITPCIIAEELLNPSIEELKLSSSIIDYKIWCFNGKADSILVCSNRRDGGCDLSVYDLNWGYHPEWSEFDSVHRERTQILPRPMNLDQMIDVAEILSNEFPEVRVDLYNIEGKIYFGEMTFTSLGGMMDYYTQEYLLKMGNQIDLSNVKLK